MYELHSDDCYVYKGYKKGVIAFFIFAFFWMLLLVYLSYLGSNYKHIIPNEPAIQVGDRNILKHLKWIWPLLAFTATLFPLILLAPYKTSYHLTQGSLEIRMYGLSFYSLNVRNITQINKYYRNQRVFGALFTNRKHILSLKSHSEKEINIVPINKDLFIEKLLELNPAISLE
jgi:hypothetical protein